METQTTEVNPLEAGQLDPGFGDFGQIRPNFLSGSVRAIVLSAEGVLTYAAWQGNGFTLYRTDLDGIPDPGFGDNGSTGEWQFVHGEDARPTRLLLQEDGKVLVIGNSVQVTGLKPAALTRFNANGSPDLVFGRVIIPIPHRDYATVDWIDGCLQADGKMLVAFGYYATTFAGSVLVRLNSNGELDTSFGDNNTGYVEVESQGNTILLRSVVIQDGKIIVGGATTSDQLVLARYDMEGKIDTQFGDNGFAFFAATAGFSFSFGQLIVQTDDKLVFAGRRVEGGLRVIGMVMRFTADGRPDELWNGGLPVLTYAGPLLRWTSLAQQLDGKLVVVGYTDNTRDEPFARDVIACRLLPNGVHDTSFGGTGWVRVGTSGGLSWDVKVQSSARIIVGGDAFIDSGGRGPVVYGLKA